ncbi:MAG: hypothetical protein IJ248_02025 [Candidatus Methanomethylophilaceae archaeon]|nr:hypothetical protein [Candidatus Methanomethylophilaceae archaeon]
MTPYSRNYILATVGVVIVSIAFLIFTSDSILEKLLTIISVAVLYPCVMMGMYFYLEGRDYRWINGMDWVSMTEGERTNTVSAMGIYMAVGCFMLSIAVPMIVSSFIIGVVLIVASIVVMIIPFLNKDRMKSKQFVQRTVPKKIAVFIAVSIITIVPTVAIGELGFTTETVIVEFEDNGLHIKAPMVNEYFEYDKIQDLELDPDFDKGTRVAGYGTPTICSGTFNNGQFGNYTLASYTKVDPCIFFQYEGHYYAFNQASDEQTQQTYDMLKAKLAS